MSILKQKYSFALLVLSAVFLYLSTTIIISNTSGQSPMISNNAGARNNGLTQSIQSYKDNLTSIFGDPLFEETSHRRTGSIVIKNQEHNQTRDSYIASGILKGVGKVLDNGTFITTELGKGYSTSKGTGVLSTSDGYNATYLGMDVGTAESSGIETYKGLQIFNANPDSKLAYLNNVIGIYLYRSWPNGTSSGTVWEWK